MWIIDFIFNPDALVPVVTVQLGEPVTFTCAAMEKLMTSAWIHWYKQTSGDTLKMIILQRKNQDPTFGPEFPSSRYRITNDDKISNLTILRTFEQDEGMYHCAITDWAESTWMGTYLMVKGNSKKTSSYTVVQQSTASESSRPQESETLQCSVLSESENNSCSEDLSMFWFKAGSNRPYPNIIYTDTKRANNCEKSPNTRRKCTYNFPKNISSSDPGTYYCAVATCGEILLGNVIRKEGGNIRQRFCFENMILLITIIVLAVSVIVHMILIFYRTQAFACQIVKRKYGLAKLKKIFCALSGYFNCFNKENDYYRVLRAIVRYTEKGKIFKSQR
uniref:Ig-like domain-containing protein n=1 Tax=Cyprinodon variegatus TaxID=28743 RepID=A0A3Q2C807_CYPVA